MTDRIRSEFERWALGSNDQLGPLPEPHLHTAALAVMNAGWERGGHVYSAAQMHAYASQEVAAALARASSVSYTHLTLPTID